MPPEPPETKQPQLNDEQRSAVEHGDGPLLIIAGAGTGKTTVVTERIVHLIKERNVPGHQIAAMTFTEKATAEMADRLYDRLSLQEATMQVGTFHAFGRLLLEHYAHHLGRLGTAHLLKGPEQIAWLTEHIDELPLTLLKPRWGPTSHLKGMLKVFSRLKNEDVTPAGYLTWVEEQQADLAEITDPKVRKARIKELAKHAEVAATYEFYETKKLERGFIDYDDQLTLPLELLREHPDALAKVRAKYRYILLDEFQDTNVVQAELAYLVAGDNGNITVVGDDDQSIYAFRGASLSNILEFEKRHPKTTRVVLRRNYRSSQKILDAAYQLIQNNNPHRLEDVDKFDKRLVAHNPDGPAITYWQNATIDDEADRVAMLIKATKAEGTPYSEIAILVPTHRDTEPFRQSLTMLNIPTIVERKEFLYQQPEIKLAVAALRVIDNPLHSSSLRVLLTGPMYSMPNDDYAKLERLEKRTQQSVWEQLAGVSSGRAGEAPGEYSEAAQTAATNARADIERFRNLTEQLNVGQVLHGYLVEHTNYVASLGGSEPSDVRAIDNLSIFFTSLKRYGDAVVNNGVKAWLHYFDNIAELSEEAASELDLSSKPDAVSIFTMHNSKGLEFDLVVLPVLVNSRIPASLRGGMEPPPELLRDPVDSDAHVREKRRLFYVALTRARKQLYLSFPNSLGGKQENLRASQFISEALGEQVAQQVPATDSAARHRIARLRRPTDLPGEYHPPDPLELSHSSISAFQDCPWKYYWDYHVKVYLPPQPQLLYGDAVHQTIRDINRSIMDAKPMAEAEALRRFREYWRGEGYVSKAEQTRALGQGVATISSFLKAAVSQPPATAVEEEFKFKLGTFYIKGKLDRIDHYEGAVRIIDYKTSDVSTQDEAEAKLKDQRNRRQLLLYAMAWRNQTGRLPDEVGLYFPQYNLTAMTVPKEPAIAKLETEISGIAKRIMDGDFRHNPSQHECSRAACNRCPTNTARNRGDFR